MLTNFIHTKLNLPYDKDFIDNQISRAHRGGADREDDGTIENQRKGPKPISAQFTNWRIAEEIKAEVIKSNVQKRTKVIVNQMYSRDLTLRRNNALKERYEMLQNDKIIQVKLEYPAV